MHVYFYLDESGPFNDHETGDFWPVSVVGGLMSFRELTNDRLRPVLDDLENFGGHRLRDADLHARELRDRLGDDYVPWMTNAIQAVGKLGDDVQVVCFRSSERLGLGNAETMYLTILVEGLTAVIPTLLERAGRAPVAVTIVLENRRVTDRITGGPRQSGGRGKHGSDDDTHAWEEQHIGRRDSAVPRASYVSLEDYATRLRTRLRLEMVRRGLGARLSMVSSLRIAISDPATDKALNFADFISHQCRYSHRPGDRDIYADAIEPMMAFDHEIILHRGYEVAERMIDEQQFGDALVALVDVITDTDSPAVREAAERLMERAFEGLRDSPPRHALREIDDYLNLVAQLTAQAQSPMMTNGDLYHPAPADAREYLRAMDKWCRTALKGLGVGASDLQTTEALAKAPAELTFAWRWGLFRSHHELLVLANQTGDLQAAAEAEEVCEPLIPPFARSVTHQPAVLDYLLDVSRADISAGQLERAIHRLTRLVQFHNDTEDWWCVDLPELLPALGDDLDRLAILCEPLGRALHMRARARLALYWPGRRPLADDDGLQTALADLTAALDEFTFAGDLFAVRTDLAMVHALAGEPADAVAWLAVAVGIEAEHLLTALRDQEFSLWAELETDLVTATQPVAGFTALAHILRRALEQPEAVADAALRAGLQTVARQRRDAIDGRARQIATNSLFAALRFMRAHATYLATAGDVAGGTGWLQKARGLGEDVTGNPAIHWAMAGIHLDAAHWATRRKHEALKAAREALRPLLGRQAGIDNTWQTAAESLANQIDEMQKSGAMGDEELRHLAGQVRLW